LKLNQQTNKNIVFLFKKCIGFSQKLILNHFNEAVMNSGKTQVSLFKGEKKIWKTHLTFLASLAPENTLPLGAFH